MRRWGILGGLVLALALVAFGLGRVEGGDPETAVRTERFRESAASSGSFGPEEIDVTTVVAREAADGTLIRVVEERWEQGPTYDAEWTPPASCYSVGNLGIGLATDHQVAQGWAEVWDDEPAGPELRGSGTAGYPSIGDIAFAAVWSLDDDLVVQLVRDGAVLDETTPIDGWAIVAAQVPADGTEVVYGDQRRDVGEVDSRSQGPECQPPPPTVPEGSERADEETRAAVQAALDAVFAREADGDPVDPRPALTDASRLTDEWMAEMRAVVATYTDDGVAVEIDDVGLVTPDEAVAVYRLVGPPVGWRTATIERVDGTWKVATASWCEVVGLVFSCP